MPARHTLLNGRVVFLRWRQYRLLTTEEEGVYDLVSVENPEAVIAFLTFRPGGRILLSNTNCNVYHISTAIRRAVEAAR